MYKSIHIQNFRCFEDTKIEGFEQINLIGGQNNAGKTALLEALYLGGGAGRTAIERLLQFRNQYNVTYENPESKPFKDFFYEQNQNQAINVTIEKKDLSTINVEVKANEYSEIEDNKIINIAELNIVLNINNEYKKESQYKTLLKNVRYITLSEEFHDKIIYFATTSLYTELGVVYEQIVKEGKKNYLLSAFQTIEKNIVEVEFINNRLLLKRENENFLIPLNLFGDAMNKLCQWVLSILSGNFKIILIDEIENGIHHSNQAKFWTMLFDLAKAFDIQVFATSHSAEMIKAFQEVASEHEVKSGYFELGRHAKTNKILGIKTQLDTLGSKLEHKMNFRGE